MTNTDKSICRELAALLVAHGVRRVFVSPGSRNAPIIVAIARNASLETTVVVDERSSAFMAMGYALIADEPVAIVCTSGTALLNYAPAVAEAYYRRIPLIVISADRPVEWIDQDDSQTLRQPKALANYVKLSCDIPEITTTNLMWYGNRLINDALIAATTGRKAPVHINVQLDAPLGNLTKCIEAIPRKISVAEPKLQLPDSLIKDLAERIVSSSKVMVIAGFLSPDGVLNESIKLLAKMPNVVVLTETISNLRSSDFISRIDTTLSVMTTSEKECLRPDIVITLGGALVSRFVKEYLRTIPPAQHWHVGIAHTTIDCFKALTLRIETEPVVFFQQMCEEMEGKVKQTTYSAEWHKIYERAINSHDKYVYRAEWSDLKAFDILLSEIPKDWNLQLSNGTPIRYAQLFGDVGFHRCDCNRGVSGIDGCTSTAVGASMAYKPITLLITGDMSAQYDVGVLAYAAQQKNLRIIVICNGGGGIFRFISSTAHLDELDDYLAFEPSLPLRELCKGYGIRYFEASDADSLHRELSSFLRVEDQCALLSVNTPSILSAEILRSYFIREKVE